jgi:uncharacterized membrane protein (DUF485 family)
MTPSPEQEPQRCDRVIELLELLERRTRRQTTAIISLILVVFYLAATFLGYVLNYMAADPLINGAAITLGGLIAISIGWLLGWSIGRLKGRRK